MLIMKEIRVQGGFQFRKYRLGLGSMCGTQLREELLPESTVIKWILAGSVRMQEQLVSWDRSMELPNRGQRFDKRLTNYR